MSYHLLDKGQLYMIGILDYDFLLTVACLKNDGVICKHREAYASLFSNQFYLVCLGTLMSNKAPTATSWESVLKSEGCRYRILGLIQSTSVSMKSGNVDNRPEEFLQQIQLVRSKIVEISSSGNITLYTPWQIGTIVVKVAWRGRETYLHIYNPAYHTFVYQAAYLIEVRKVSAIICHKARHASLCTDVHDSLTIHIRCSQRFFHIHRLACLHCHYGICGMRRGWGGNVYSIDLRVIDE